MLLYAGQHWHSKLNIYLDFSFLSKVVKEYKNMNKYIKDNKLKYEYVTLT